MKTRERTLFVCQACGYSAIKWLGRCPDCGGWNSLVEERVLKESGTGAVAGGLSSEGPPLSLIEIPLDAETRISSGISEFDRVLGGGLVPGSLLLIGGDPGIGKSTLLLQTLAGLGKRELVTLYVSGEESVRQIRLRGERIGAIHPNIYTVTETSVERILSIVKDFKPAVLVVDSIQTLYSSELGSAPGSVSQLRESASKLMVAAKQTGLPVILIGHVTKEGVIAGPRVLEHMVDVVIYFEGDPSHAYRILRTVKNRYGSTNEVGVFEMKDGGLTEVTNPSEIFLHERPTQVPGSVVVASMEGTRPILIEVQALVSAAGIGMPRRTAIGIDPQRVSLLAAVLEKRNGLVLHDRDIYINVAGGIRIDEPAVDLGTVLAIISSFLERSVDPKLVVFGEVGLAGEIRGVAKVDLRLAEAARLGFTRCIIPRSNLDHVKNRFPDLIGASNLNEVIEHVFK
ncbi:MAG: DNA repair protein RadA [Pseudomonadota bacterium]